MLRQEGLLLKSHYLESTYIAVKITPKQHTLGKTRSPPQPSPTYNEFRKETKANRSSAGWHTGIIPYCIFKLYLLPNLWHKFKPKTIHAHLRNTESARQCSLFNYHQNGATLTLKTLKLCIFSSHMLIFLNVFSKQYERSKGFDLNSLGLQFSTFVKVVFLKTRGWIHQENEF